MAEQAQSDAGDLDGLQDGPQDAPQDPTNLPTQDPYTRLMKELNEPDTPPPQGRQSTAAAPAGTRQATTESVKRHSNSIRGPNCPNVAGFQAPKRPTRSGGPRQNPQPPSPKLQIPSAHPRPGKHIRSYVRPAWTPPTTSIKEKV